MLLISLFLLIDTDIQMSQDIELTVDPATNPMSLVISHSKVLYLQEERAFSIEFIATWSTLLNLQHVLRTKNSV
jgi:hypothetical protein